MTGSMIRLELVQRGAGNGELQQHRRDVLAGPSSLRPGIETEAVHGQDIAGD